MFGNNQPRGPQDTKEGLLQVHEVFYTLQGEGPFSGHPAVFIRLSGCNLRCWFCDTKWDDENDPYCYPEQIVANVKSLHKHGRLVVLTGGEPLRQDASELVKLLLAEGFIVQVETAGTYWRDFLSWKGVYTVVSPKNSRINPRFMNLDILRDDGKDKVCFKYVIVADRLDAEDMLPIGDYQRLVNGKIGGGRLARPWPGATVYLQPCDEYDEEKNKLNNEAVAEACLKHGYIGGVQVHKYLKLP